MQIEPAQANSSIGGGAAGLPRSGSALLLVDFINPLRFAGAQEIARPALAAARAARTLKQRLAARGVPAIYANDNDGTWHSDFGSLLETCQRRGGVAAELAERSRPSRAT